MSKHKNNPIFQDSDIEIRLKKHLGWTDADTYPSGVLVTHELPKTDSRFYDDGVYYVPQRFCEMKQTTAKSWCICSLCGAFVSKNGVTDAWEPIPVNYCPNCGAKVVEE